MVLKMHYDKLHMLNVYV